MMSNDQIGIAFCWYEEDEWEKLKQTATDSETLDDSYSEWKRNANKVINELMTHGHKISKIAIKIDTLDVWCQKNNCKNDSKARSRYAVEILQKRTRET